MMVSPKSLRLEKSLRLGFRASNNEIEYEALIAGLRLIQKLWAKKVEVCSDSRLVVSQIDESFETRDYCMSQYLKLFGSLQVNFQKVSAVRVPRSSNSHTDSLATLALSLDDYIPRMILVEFLEQPSIELQTVVAVTLVWRTSACFWLSKDKKVLLTFVWRSILVVSSPEKDRRVVG